MFSLFFLSDLFLGSDYILSWLYLLISIASGSFVRKFQFILCLSGLDLIRQLVCLSLGN